MKRHVAHYFQHSKENTKLSAVTNAWTIYSVIFNNSVCVLLLTTFRAAFVSNLRTLLSLNFSSWQGYRQDVQLSWLTSDPVVCHRNSRTCRKDSSAFNPNNEKNIKKLFPIQRNENTRLAWIFLCKTICWEYLDQRICFWLAYSRSFNTRRDIVVT